MNPNGKQALLFLIFLFNIMINRVWLIIVLIILFSCSEKSRFPQLKSKKISMQQVNLLEGFQFTEMDSSRYFNMNQIFQTELDQLYNFHNWYFQKNESFSLKSFEELWHSFNIKFDISNLNALNTIKWFEINGTLLQLTNGAKYAEEMERILLSGMPYFMDDSVKIENIVVPFIYTKNIDNIYVNLFTPSEIVYEHTLFGNVKIWQETNYSDSGNISVKFNMEKRRYIELFIRIPEWAEGATVTVKKVKYFAPPGGYCQIAKKWQEGDEVEIYLPLNNYKTEFTTTNSSSE